MGNVSSEASWEETFKHLKLIHDAAYQTIEEAIKLEEQERPNDAVDKYKEGIHTLDNALDVVIASPDEPDDTWDHACEMVKKMKKTRAEVLMRINSITSSPSYIQHEPPPSYEDATSNSDGSQTPVTYRELAEALDNLHIETPQGAAEIIYSHDRVKLYFISPDGQVLSTSEPQTLNIALLDGEEGTQPIAFLQVGTWIYPLIPGVSPCYRTDYGAFILPDVHSDIKGSSVGLILPLDGDIAVLDLLESILHGVATKDSQSKVLIRRTRRDDQEPGISGSISRGLVQGSILVSKGLIYGSQKVGELLNYGTPKLIQSMTPAPAETAVPSNVKTGLKIAKTATSKAAEVTGFVAEKVGVATSKLGHFLAPHIQTQGTKILSTHFNMTEAEASARVSGVLTVAAGAVEGFATVYQGLETSSSILAKNLVNNSVRIVEHKYGANAGEVADDTLNTVGNIINIRNHTKYFTPKNLVKTTAKQTGKALAHEFHMPDATPSTSAGFTNIRTEKFSSEEPLKKVKRETMNDIEDEDEERDGFLYPSVTSSKEMEKKDKI